MSNWAWACCCGYGDVCGCNPFYGGPTTYTATWTGSVTAGGTNCACYYSIYGPPMGAPATYGDVVDPETWSGGSMTMTWFSTNILVPGFCKLNGQLALSDWSGNEYQFYNGNCTLNSAVPNLNVNSTIIIEPPFPLIGRNFWRADCNITGMLRVQFRNDTLSCHPNNANWYVESIISSPPLGCNDWLGIADWSYSAGTFTLV